MALLRRVCLRAKYTIQLTQIIWKNTRALVNEGAWEYVGFGSRIVWEQKDEEGGEWNGAGIKRWRASTATRVWVLVKGVRWDGGDGMGR